MRFVALSFIVFVNNTMDESLVQLIKSQIRERLPEVVDLRHRLHAEPELGLDTAATAAKIRSALARTSLEMRQPLIGNDVIGELQAGIKTICLRADIDAIPVAEANDLPHKSRIPGAMHACGHDGHTAMLVGAALVLDSLKDRLGASVRFVFQPGEELICAGKTLVERGALQGCEAAYAIHGWSGLPAGYVVAKEGPAFAAGSHFDITITGKGCHGALPDKGNNPIPVAARIAESLQRMHERLNLEDGTVVSVCAFQAGDSSNVIPDTAIVRGTARYLSTKRGDMVEQGIRNVVDDAAGASSVTGNIDYHRAYDLPLVNTRGAYQLIKELAGKYAKFMEKDRVEMTMDDFAYYLPEREGAMFLLGLGESWPALHSQRFDFNDEVIETGALMHCLIALSY